MPPVRSSLVHRPDTAASGTSIMVRPKACLS
jgi:hypothetical protein